MGLFIDSANLKDVKEALSWNALKGVTTNPTILAKEKGKKEAVLKNLIKLKPRMIFVQVRNGSVKAMEEEALKLHSMSPSNMVVKIPFSPNCLKLIEKLKKKDMRTCPTAIFSPVQGYAAAAAGADYVAVYVGRITRHGGDGLDVIKKLSKMIERNLYDAKILAASIPDIDTMDFLFRIPFVDVTAPMDLISKMLEHPLTDKAIEKFDRA